MIFLRVGRRFMVLHRHVFDRMPLILAGEMRYPMLQAHVDVYRIYSKIKEYVWKVSESNSNDRFGSIV